jgi:uncharacterized membrane protein
MYHWGYFFPFGLVFFLIIIGFFMTNMILWRRRGGMCYHNQSDALSILESRLARGEITGEEFYEIKETLKGKKRYSEKA